MKHLFFVLLIFLVSCANDVLPEPVPTMCGDSDPTYDVDIRPVIEASCAYSGCHLGGNTVTFAGYADLLPSIENGSFRDRVITQRADVLVGMPPDYAPDDRPQNLTPEELTLLECWLEAGHPEN